MKGLAIIILCSLLASAYSVENNGTEPAPLSGKSFNPQFTFHRFDREPPHISNVNQVLQMERNRPDPREQNLVLIYQDQLFITSGALITHKNLLYVSTLEEIQFTNTGNPFRNYIVKVPSFLPNSPDSNIYKIEKLIVKHEPIAIVELKIEKQCFVPVPTPIAAPIGPLGLEYTVKRRKKPHGPVEDTLFRPAMSSQLDIFGITSSPLPEDLEDLVGALLFCEKKLVGICVKRIENVTERIDRRTVLTYYYNLPTFKGWINSHVGGLLPGK